MINTGFAIFWGAVVLILYLIFAYIKNKDFNTVLLNSVVIVYFVALICITLFPIKLNSPATYFGEIIWYNFKPFFTIKNMMRTNFSYMFLQVFGNVLLTVPYGIFVIIFLKKHNFFSLICIAVLFALVIESMQFLVGISVGNIYRTIDVDDLILNTLGVIIGYLCFIVYKSIKLK